jgi:TRAP-type C4-dicarboxylate transport system permease small subunit
MTEQYHPDDGTGDANVPAYAVWADRSLTVVAGIILFSTMTMTVIDVFGRYLFNAPLGFAYEMTELAMAVTFFIALSVVTLRGEHISVGLFDTLVTGRLATAREAIVAACLAVGAGYLAWRMYLFAGRLEDYGDTTNVLKVTIYPFCYLGAAGIGLAALAGAVRVADACRRLVRPAR